MRGLGCTGLPDDVVKTAPVRRSPRPPCHGKAALFEQRPRPHQNLSDRVLYPPVALGAVWRRGRVGEG
eukprot:13187525-Heterocapsa_arctica.AAC.1